MPADLSRVHGERPLDGQDLPRPASGLVDTRYVRGRAPHVSALTLTRYALEIALQERDEARDAARLLHDLWNTARRAA